MQNYVGSRRDIRTSQSAIAIRCRRRKRCLSFKTCDNIDIVLLGRGDGIPIVELQVISYVQQNDKIKITLASLPKYVQDYNRMKAHRCNYMHTRTGMCKHTFISKLHGCKEQNCTSAQKHKHRGGRTKPH